MHENEKSPEKCPKVQVKHIKGKPFDCIAFPMGGFVGVNEDGVFVSGRRDPVTKEVYELHIWEK